MTERLTPEGTAVLESYLDEVRQSLHESDVDATEVCSDIRDHVRESVGIDRAQPADADEVRAILKRLGEPSDWEAHTGRDKTEPTPSKSASSRPDWAAVGVFALAVLSLCAFPWIGPVGLILSWVIGRVILASRASRSQRSDAGLIWVRVPVAAIAIGFAALFLLGPLGPLFELAGRSAARFPRWAMVIGGIGLWWAIMGLVVHRFTAAVQWLLLPLPLRRPHGRTLALVGAVTLAVGLILFALGARRAEAAEPADQWEGRYEYTAEMQGRPMNGAIELRRDSSGEFTGELRLGELPPARITGATRADSTLELKIELPEGSGTVQLFMSDEASFTGQILLGGHQVEIEGRRTRVGPPPVVSDFLATIRPQLEELVPRGLENFGEAGLAVAIFDHGKTWTQGYGLASREDSVRVTPQTLFQLGSISKLLSAWGVLHLVDAGKLELDAAAESYLVRWHLPAGPHDARGVTVRRLLSHTAGLNVPSISGVDLGQKIPDLVTELDGRGRGPEWQVHITMEPGREFRYSGGGYMVLQLMVEDQTGRDFAEYMRDEVLLPLGMKESSYQWTETVAQSVATPYSRDPERNRRQRLFAGVAGAGLYSSAEDMAQLMAAHFSGLHGEPPGRGVIQPGTLQTMEQPDSVAAVYGLGYEITHSSDGAVIVGHSGSNVGWKADLLIAPDKHVGIAVLTNDDVGRTRSQVVDLARELMSRVKTSVDLMHPHPRAGGPARSRSPG